MKASRLVLVATLPVALVFGLLSCATGGDGTQMKPPACSLSATSLPFGTVSLGATKALTFSITNVGEGTLAGTVTAPCGDYSIQGAASYSLGAGASATITVRFAPSVGGARNCTLDVGSACAAVSCTGTGLGPCEASPTSLDFGTVFVGESVDRDFTITNNGNGTLSGTVTSPCGEYTFVGNADYTLGPGAFQTITVRFKPSQLGARNCTLDVGLGCAQVSCAGIGASPCQVSPTSLAFGAVAPGTTKDLSFTITNLGSGTLAGTVTSPCVEYTFVGSPSYNLGAGGSATITVRFAPSQSGASCCALDTGNPDCPNVACTGSGGPELGSGTLGKGATYAHTFDCPGTYPYHCGFHPTMRGTVIVAAGEPVSASVNIQGFSFNPPTARVAPGGTVTWTNNDDTPHTVTSD